MRLINPRARREAWLALAFILCASFAAQGQEYWEFVRAGQANAGELRQYSWKARTEVFEGGETKGVRLHLVRHDADGAPRQTLIGGSAPRQMPTRGPVARKKREDFVETLDGLAALAKSYGSPPPAQTQRFIAGATVTPGAGQRAGLFRLEGRDVLRPGDSMVVWVDALTRRHRRVEVETTFERQRVRIISEFRDLPDGPTYAARSVIDYPSRGLVVTTENFDHARALSAALKGGAR